MKDAYSFHETNEELDEWYQKFARAYTNIFLRCGLETRIVSSDVGQIGGNEADEFMVMSEVGEDTITYCESCKYASNQEHSGLNDGDVCPECGGLIHTAKGIEVGNIFKLGTKYSESMNCKVVNKDGETVPVVMGCYGIGISRTLMASVEQHATEDGILWPDEIAPFDVHVIPVNHKNEAQWSLAQTVYEKLKQKGKDVLFDDREERAGVKFKDADLIGIRYRVVVGKDAENDLVEFVDRKSGNKQVVSLEKLLSLI